MSQGMKNELGDVLAAIGFSWSAAALLASTKFFDRIAAPLIEALPYWPAPVTFAVMPLGFFCSLYFIAPRHDGTPSLGETAKSWFAMPISLALLFLYLADQSGIEIDLRTFFSLRADALPNFTIEVLCGWSAAAFGGLFVARLRRATTS